MLSNTSRWLTYLNAIFYAIVGAALFLLPEQMAPVFAWKITGFMAMTMGGWALGTAWLAWITARRWDWRRVYTALIHLWAFGLLEMAVLVIFRDKVRLPHPIAWLYLLALAVNVLAAVVGVIDWLRLKPAMAPSGPAIDRGSWLGALAFVIFVGFLALYGMFAPVGAPGTNGGIFPEVMSTFTLRAFAAFYVTLTLGVLPLLWERQYSTYLHHGLAAFALVVFITIAAFAYLRLFDFSRRPGGLVYIGAYLVVGVPLLIVFLRRGTGLPQPNPA